MYLNKLENPRAVNLHFASMAFASRSMSVAWKSETHWVLNSLGDYEQAQTSAHQAFWRNLLIHGDDESHQRYFVSDIHI